MTFDKQSKSDMGLFYAEITDYNIFFLLRIARGRSDIVVEATIHQRHSS